MVQNYKKNSNPGREAKLATKARQIIDGFIDKPNSVKNAKNALFYSFTTALHYHKMPDLMHSYVEDIQWLYELINQIENYQEEEENE